jgi:hypothetical protein
VVGLFCGYKHIGHPQAWAGVASYPGSRGEARAGVDSAPTNTLVIKNTVVTKERRHWAKTNVNQHCCHNYYINFFVMYYYL